MTFVDEQLFEEYIKLVKSIEPTLSIEIGAFDADFSNYIAQEGICNNIYAFEASKYVYNRCKLNVSPKINYINAAIASYTGSINFNFQSNYDPSFVGLNSIKLKNNDIPIITESVDCYSVDDYFLSMLSDKDKVVIWIDAEGAADEVLKGMTKILSIGIVYSIFIETEHQNFWKNAWLHDDVNNFLTQNGMDLKKSKFQYIGQTNCIYGKR